MNPSLLYRKLIGLVIYFTNNKLDLFSIIEGLNMTLVIVFVLLVVIYQEIRIYGKHKIVNIH